LTNLFFLVILRHEHGNRNKQIGRKKTMKREKVIMCKKAFTLIELLVTIAIIAIIAGMILYSVHKAREQGYSLYCKNNLKQIGLGVSLYGNDYGYYPPAQTISTDYSLLLNVYLNPKEGDRYGFNDRSPLFKCPKGVLSTDKKNPLCYAGHTRIMPNTNTQAFRPLPYMANKIHRPSDILLIAESCQVTMGHAYSYLTQGANLGWYQYDNPDHPNIGISQADTPAPGDWEKHNIDINDNATWTHWGWIRWRHTGNKVTNVLFSDTHVDNIRMGNLLYRNVVLKFADGSRHWVE